MVEYIGNLEKLDEITFSLVSNEIKTISLKQLIQDNPVMLNFILGTWCPSCSKFINRILQANREDQINKNRVLIVSTEKAKRLQNFFEKRIKWSDIPIGVISDESKKLINHCKLTVPVLGFARPASILFQPDGKYIILSKGIPNQDEFDANLCDLDLHQNKSAAS